MPLFLAEASWSRDVIDAGCPSPSDRFETIVRYFDTLGARVLLWNAREDGRDWVVVMQGADIDAVRNSAATDGAAPVRLAALAALDDPDSQALIDRAGCLARAVRSRWFH